MTDKERLIALLTDFGVEFSLGEGAFGEEAVIIESKTGPKNVGYAGFQAVFEFFGNGNFEEVGIWE